ncbi:cysteine desulfurase OS=Streptomyces alboniger OX=132473 GN=CP975_08145 PE=3 SV=1 [Streptomyces alboniger]
MVHGGSLAQRTGAKLKWFGLSDDLSNIEEVITEKTKIVSFVLVSDPGSVDPVEAIVRVRRKSARWSYMDPSQAAPHMPMDVQALQATWLGLHRPQDVGP